MKHNYFKIIFFLLLVALQMPINGNAQTTLEIDFNECMSNFVSGTNADFSEFTGTATGDNPDHLSLSQDHLYRTNPEANTHSCTPGVENSPAMCVSYLAQCTPDFSSDRAIKVDLVLDPLDESLITLTELSFFHLSPQNFDWIGGASGPNNYAQYFGVQIMDNMGSVLVQIDSVATTQDWQQYSLSLAEFDGLAVNEVSTFKVKILPFCPINNGENTAVWDIDQFTVTAATGCLANGGDLSGGPFEFTVGDGEADMIPAGSISLTNSIGNSQWVVTDDQGYILGLPPMPSVVDFDGAGPGNCFVYHLSSIGSITGLTPGSNISDFTGCYDISNNVEVIRTNVDACQANGGDLFGGPFEFTVGDGEADMIPAGSITVANSN